MQRDHRTAEGRGVGPVHVAESGTWLGLEVVQLLKWLPGPVSITGEVGQVEMEEPSGIPAIAVIGEEN